MGGAGGPRLYVRRWMMSRLCFFLFEFAVASVFPVFLFEGRMKMAKKSAAQVRRMQQRAVERGEEYNPSRSSTSDDEGQPSNAGNDLNREEKISAPAWLPRLVKLAKKLKQSLKEIEGNAAINAKERRSEKRKLLAISAEKAECTVDDVVTFLSSSEAQEDEESLPKKKQKTFKSSPYVLFVGQMAYSTTAAALLEHFQKALGDHVITPDNFKVRLLTDATKNRSRGMAFIEANDPKVLFECLKLHHTTLDGRRINVERTTGGGKTSEKRKEKIKQYRQEQQDHMSQTVDKIIMDYRTQGVLSQDELDKGVIELCKRHSCTVVKQAIEEYIEAKGKRMENPSAYLTHIITRIAEEGIAISTDAKKTRLHIDATKSAWQEPKSSKRKLVLAEEKIESSSKSKYHTEPSSIKSQRGINKGFESEFVNAGVQMTFSESNSKDKGLDLSQIFPSMRRGRGRG